MLNPLCPLIKLKSTNVRFEFYGRGNRNRTCDPLHPMQVLYQAELCPDMPNILNQHLPKYKYFFRYSYILLGCGDMCKIYLSGQKVFTTNKKGEIYVKNGTWQRLQMQTVQWYRRWTRSRKNAPAQTRKM